MASQAHKLGPDAFRPFGGDYQSTDGQDHPGTQMLDESHIVEARTSGHREGYAKGYADGVEAGGAAERTRMIAEQADLMRALSAALSASVEPLLAQMENHRRMLIDGARTLAEDILSRLAPTSQHDLIIEILTTFLQAGDDGDFFRIFVSPEAQAAVRDLVEKAKVQKHGSDKKPIPIEVHPDASLSMGEFRVDWPGGEVERRLDNTKTMIEYYFPYQDEKPEATYDKEPAHD